MELSTHIVVTTNTTIVLIFKTVPIIACDTTREKFPLIISRKMKVAKLTRPLKKPQDSSNFDRMSEAQTSIIPT